MWTAVATRWSVTPSASTLLLVTGGGRGKFSRFSTIFRKSPRSPRGIVHSVNQAVNNSWRADSTRSRNWRSRWSWFWTLSTLWITVE